MSLETRLARLEARNRGLMVVVVVMLGFAVFAAANQVPGYAKQIDTRMLRIVDSDGKPRIGFLVQDSVAMAVFFDQAGTMKLAIKVGKEESGVYLMEATDRPSGAFKINNDATGLYLYAGGINASVAMATLREERRSGIFVADKDGEIVWAAP